MGVFEENKTTEKLGKCLGYIFAYFLFTTAFFLILDFLKKLPSSWSYLNIMGITLLIALIGFIIKRLLK